MNKLMTEEMNERKDHGKASKRIGISCVEKVEGGLDNPLLPLPESGQEPPVRSEG